VVERSQHDIMVEKFGIILPILNERQRRLLLAAEANALGHGGIIAETNRDRRGAGHLTLSRP
jgi:hypothetical protein